MAKAKKAKGRPLLDDDVRKDHVVRVLMAEDEHDEVRAAAATASMSVSTFVRGAALEKARRGAG